MRRITTLCAAALAALASPAYAVDVLLDFSGNICGTAGTGACGNGSAIGQNYGDLADVLDVSHRSITSSTGNTFEQNLKYWSTGYSGLTGVAWGGSNGSNYIAEMVFTPGAGQRVTLNAMDFGDYQNRNNGSSVRILDLGTEQVLWEVPAFNPDLTPTSFSPAVSSASGLVLRWGPDAYDTGIDNISLSVTAVPEPGTWALMLGGAALLAARTRRRA